MRKRRQVAAIVSFTNAEVMSAMQEKFNDRFVTSGVKTGTLFMELDTVNDTVSFVQYKGGAKSV